jgi:glycosyltransferase involved in cell wall biosynthesis
MFLSIVIPQYNESENLKAKVLDRVYQYLTRQNYSWEVIIVDDGSSDNSVELATTSIRDKKGFTLYEAQHGGKPLAILHGVEKAQGEYILLADMDQSTPISELEKLLKYTPKFEAIIGSRGKRRSQASLLRKAAGFIFSSYRRVLILGEIVDTQCGFKLFKADLIKKLFPLLSAVQKDNVKGWSVSAFDVELLFMIKKAGREIKEVWVKWNDEDLSLTKDRKFIQESLDMVKQIMMIQLNNLKGKYAKLN